MADGAHWFVRTATRRIATCPDCRAQVDVDDLAPPATTAGRAPDETLARRLRCTCGCRVVAIERRAGFEAPSGRIYLFC